MPPTQANGKVCYIEIPATGTSRLADFYGKVFGWHIRQRTDGPIAFDDTTGEPSGTWALGRHSTKSPAAQAPKQTHLSETLKRESGRPWVNCRHESGREETRCSRNGQQLWRPRSSFSLWCLSQPTERSPSPACPATQFEPGPEAHRALGPLVSGSRPALSS